LLHRTIIHTVVDFIPPAMVQVSSSVKVLLLRKKLIIPNPVTHHKILSRSSSSTYIFVSQYPQSSSNKEDKIWQPRPVVCDCSIAIALRQSSPFSSPHDARDLATRSPSRLVSLVDGMLSFARARGSSRLERSSPGFLSSRTRTHLDTSATFRDGTLCHGLLLHYLPGVGESLVESTADHLLSDVCLGTCFGGDCYGVIQECMGRTFVQTNPR
jgi:hypothetical protein